MTAKENYELWLKKVTDEDVKKGLLAMKDDENVSKTVFTRISNSVPADCAENWAQVPTALTSTR